MLLPYLRKSWHLILITDSGSVSGEPRRKMWPINKKKKINEIDNDKDNQIS